MMSMTCTRPLGRARTGFGKLFPSSTACNLQSQQDSSNTKILVLPDVEGCKWLRNGKVKRQWAETCILKVRQIDPNTFFGKGKVTELALYLAENPCSFVFINTTLTPNQSRNLESDPCQKHTEALVLRLRIGTCPKLPRRQISAEDEERRTPSRPSPPRSSTTPWPRAMRAPGGSRVWPSQEGAARPQWRRGCWSGC